jgi:hypothetical protein
MFKLNMKPYSLREILNDGVSILLTIKEVGSEGRAKRLEAQI